MRLVGVHKGSFLEEIGIFTHLPYVSENNNFLCSMRLYWVPQWFEHKHDINDFFFSLTNFISSANFSKWELAVQTNLQTLCSINLAGCPIKSHSNFSLLKAWAHCEVHQEAHEHTKCASLVLPSLLFFSLFFFFFPNQAPNLARNMIIWHLKSIQTSMWFYIQTSNMIISGLDQNE